MSNSQTSPATGSGGAARFLGVADLAAELGVSTGTVTKWVARYPADSAHPFPAPDVHIGNVYGWEPSRIEEIKQWRAGMPGQGTGGGRPRKTEG
ncbi:helix-turn-helix transcriptional regulator [Actinopolyspora halophila]|uniref:helix-turn-helix transcriptional regulator n=1 Tax=Actinopolyspora halophila TaxID=1850 RepID=UPI0003755CB3|nr:hypothetical protein [Actinopolyspora halophila]